MVLVTAFSAIGLSGSGRDRLTAHGQPKTWAQAAAGLEDGGASAKGKTVAAGTLQKAGDAAQTAARERLEENDRSARTAKGAVTKGGTETRAAGKRIADKRKDKEAAAQKQQATGDREQEKGAPEAGETPEARIAYDEQDYEVMLKIVQAEAGGCDSTGKILVANVIMNRVEDSSFPDDITSVVYERSQFSPVSSGAIDQVKVTKETVECVDRALRGEDHSQGALYFMNRGASGDNAQWFDRKLTYLFSHDGHEFFK